MKRCENMENKTKVAVYCRVAREDDEVIKNQEEMLWQFAEKNGYNNISIYADNGFNGLNFNRPAFIRLNEDISAGLIEIVIVKDISRISRNYLDASEWINNIRGKGVSFKSVLDNVDDNFINEIIHPLRQFFNEYGKKPKCGIV